ncbi:hypothetical protein DRJ17_00960 [Candidatus Woesearchaeota archaeon]|nr:MAG: hypothetical protein DRJ17_00960 [Candidatus Woesearchaeota archaeon]
MMHCMQKLELFLLEEEWNKAPLWDHDDQKKINIDREGDFDIDFTKMEVELGFGFFSVKIPRDAFLIEVGRALLDECCGGEFTKWLMKQKQR